MTIYNVLFHGRDVRQTWVHPFSSKRKAIDEAKKMINEFVTHEGCCREYNNYRSDAGCVYHAEYRCDGSSVSVIRQKIDRKIEI